MDDLNKLQMHQSTQFKQNIIGNIEQDTNQQFKTTQQENEAQKTLNETKTEVKSAQDTMQKLLSSEEVYGEKLEKKETTKETEAETKQRQRTEKVRKFAIKCAQKFLADWAKRVESDPNAEVPKLNIKIKGIEGLANATVLAAMAIRGHIMETYADKKEVLSKLLNAVNFNLIASDPMQEEGSSAADNIDFAPEVIKTAKVEAIDKSVKYSHDKEEKIPMGTLGVNITSTVFYSLTKNAPKFKSAKFVNTSKVIITKNKLSAEKMSEIESKCIDNGIYYVDAEGEVQICTEQKLEELNKTIDAFKDDETKKNTIKEVVGAWKNTAKQEKKEEKPDGKGDGLDDIPDTIEIDTNKAIEKGAESVPVVEEKEVKEKEKSSESKTNPEVNEIKEEHKEDKPKMTPKQAAEAIAEANYKVRGCNVDKIHLEWDSTDLETVLRVQREIETRIKNINESKARVPVAIKTAKKCIDEKVELLKENELSKIDYEIAMEALKVKASEKVSQKQLKKQKKAAIEKSKQEEKLKKEKLEGTGEKIEEKDKLQQKDDTKEKKALDKTEPVIEKKNEEKIIEKKNEDIVIEKKTEEKQDNDKNQSNEDDLNSSLNLDLDQMNKEKNDNNDKKENEELEKKLAEEKLQKQKEEQEKLKKDKEEKERIEREQREQERLKKIAEEKEQERLKKIAEEEKEKERLRKIEEARKAEEERLKVIEDEKKARKALKDELFGYRRENDEKEGHDYFKIRTQYDELLNLLAKEESDERNIDIYILTTQMHELTKDYKTHHKSWGIKKDNGKQRIAAVAKVNAIVEKLQTENKQYKDKAEQKLAQIEKEKQEEERIRQEKAKEEKLAKEKQERIEKRKVDKKIATSIGNIEKNSHEVFNENDRKKLREKEQRIAEKSRGKEHNYVLQTLQNITLLHKEIEKINKAAALDDADSNEMVKNKDFIIYQLANTVRGSLTFALLELSTDVQNYSKNKPRRSSKDKDYETKKAAFEEQLNILQAKYNTVSAWNAEINKIIDNLSASADKQKATGQKYMAAQVKKQREKERQTRYQKELAESLEDKNCILKNSKIKAFTKGAEYEPEGADFTSNMDFEFDDKYNPGIYIKNLLLTSGIYLDSILITTIYEESHSKDKNYTPEHFVDDILSLAKKGSLGESITDDKLFTLPLDSKNMDKAIAVLRLRFNLGINLEEVAVEMNSMNKGEGNKGDIEEFVNSVKPAYITYKVNKKTVQELIIGMNENNEIFTASSEKQFDPSGNMINESRKAKKLSDFGKDARIVYTSTVADEREMDEQVAIDKQLDKNKASLKINEQAVKNYQQVGRFLAKQADKQ